MAVEAQALIAMLLALAAVSLLTPVAIRLALAVNMVDRPGGYKAHAHPTPYLGGLALVLATLIGAGAVTGARAALVVVAAGALLVALLGTLDDWRTVPVALRVAVESLVAAAVWAGGAGWSVFGGVTDLVLTVVWIVLVVNAVNLMDNQDGAAGAVVATSALGMGVLGVMEGVPLVAVLAFALVGSSLGFLPFNLSRPARVFMGDGGSLPAGFLLASVAMALPVQGDVGVAVLLGGGLLIGLPLADVLLVVVSRLRRGARLTTAGRDHLAHHLGRRLGSVRRAAAALGAGQFVLCAIGLVALQLGRTATLTAAAVCTAVVVLGIVRIEILAGPRPGAPA